MIPALPQPDSPAGTQTSPASSRNSFDCRGESTLPEFESLPRTFL
jgi:hypothetical protein